MERPDPGWPVRARPLRSFAMGGDQVAVLGAGLDRPVVLGREEAAVLGRCTRFRLAEEHLRADPGASPSILAGLVAQGLLVDGRDQGGPSPGSPIERLGVLIEDGAEGPVRWLRRACPQAELVLVDRRSGEAGAVEQPPAGLLRLGSGQRRGLAAALVARGLDAELVGAMLAPPQRPASLLADNAWLLAVAGRRSLLVDGKMLLRMGEDALGWLAEHEQILGRRPADPAALGLDGIDDAALTHLLLGQARVVVTTDGSGASETLGSTLGIDGSHDVPPVLPALGDGGAFLRALLGRSAPWALWARLPALMPATPPDDPGTGPPLAWLLAGLVQEAPVAAVMPAEGALAQVGRHLVELSRASPAELHNAVVPHALRWATRPSNLPPAAAAHRVDQIVAGLSRSPGLLPAGPVGWPQLRSLLRAQGELLGRWPEIRAHARDLEFLAGGAAS